jgi:hypothetical protein
MPAETDSPQRYEVPFEVERYLARLREAACKATNLKFPILGQVAVTENHVLFGTEHSIDGSSCILARSNHIVLQSWQILFPHRAACG